MHIITALYDIMRVIMDVFKQLSLATSWRPSPQGGSRSLQWSESGMEDTQEDPLVVHCFCVCSGSALLGDLLGVSRSRERDRLSC